MMDENGEEVTAIDATELLKSMSMRIESLEQENGADESLVKSMNLIVDMLKAQDGRLKAQDGLINTMSKRLDKISKSGTGRRTIVTTQENLTKSESVDSDLNGAGVYIMAKAENAMSEGKIFARHVAEIEGCLNSGREIPAHIMANLK